MRDVYKRLGSKAQQFHASSPEGKAGPVGRANMMALSLVDFKIAYKYTNNDKVKNDWLSSSG
jgi:hypothetical protein